MASINRIAYPIINVLPNPIQVSTGATSASVLVIWNIVSLGYAPGSFTGTLRTGSSGGTVVGTGASGSASLTVADGDLLFAVFVDTDGNTFFTSEAVAFQFPTMSSGSQPTVNASPNPALVAPGQTSALVSLTWSAAFLTSVTSTSVRLGSTGGTVVASSASAVGFGSYTAHNGDVLYLVDQSNAQIATTTVALQELPTLPNLGGKSTPARYPVEISQKGSTAIIQFDNGAEQRWKECPQLATITLQYADVSAYDLSLMQTFFISKKGSFIDTGLANCFVVVLGTDVFNFCRFLDDQLQEVETKPNRFSFTLRIEQVRVN